MATNRNFQNPIHQEENTPLVTIMETKLATKQSTAQDARGVKYIIDLTKASFGGIVYPLPGTQWILKRISNVWTLMARAPQQNPQLGTSFTPAVGQTYIGNEGDTHVVGNLVVAGTVTSAGSGLPDPDIGVIRAWTKSTPPTGHLLADGSAVSRTTYSLLFGVIGTTYGAGDGSTTFNLPNLKGRAIVGFDGSQAEFNTLGQTGGEKAHTLTSSELAGHTHTVSAVSVGNNNADHTHAVSLTSSTESSTHTHTIGADNDTASGSFGYSVHRGAGGGAVQSNASSGQSVNHTHTLSGNTGGVSAFHQHALTGNTDSAGSGTAHNNLQPYIVLYYVIKALSTGSGGGGGGGSSTLAGLTDVTITSPVSNQVLEYNGSKWINVSAPAGSLAGLTDVALSGLSSNQLLSYNGTKWVNLATISTSNIPVPLNLVGATAATALYGASVTGDSNQRLTIGADGKHSWGTGAAAPDTNMYRGGVGILQTDGNIALPAVTQQVNIGSSGSVSASFATQRTAATDIALTTRLTGDTTGSRHYIYADGKLAWGDATISGGDTNLYRSAASTLKTDSALTVAGAFTVGTVQVDPSSPATSNVLRYNGTKYVSAALAEGDITNLTTDLAGKQPLATITAKGDLYAGTASATTTNLPVGTNNQVLVADSTQTTGLRWVNSPGGTPVATRMISNAFQSIPNTTFNVVNFTSAVFDTNISWSVANPSRFTCKIAGYYLCNANVSWATSSAGTQRTLIWQVNGSQINGSDGVVPPSAGAIIQSAATLEVFLNVGDYVELGAYQDTGGALNIGNNSYSPAYNSMSISLIGSSTTMVGPTIRAGTITQFAGAVAPNGWVMCDGTSYLRTTYPDLFNSIGTTYGSVDGTHFTVPNFNGRVALGVGASSAPGATSHALTTTGGEETHTMTTAELVAHQHKLGIRNDGSTVSNNIQLASTGNTYAFHSSGVQGNQTGGGADGLSYPTTGGGTPFNELPPYLTVNFIIKTSDSSDIVNGSVTNAKLAWDIITTKGDMIAATGAGAVTRVGVGADGTVLTADSTQVAGVGWKSTIALVNTPSNADSYLTRVSGDAGNRFSINADGTHKWSDGASPGAWDVSIYRSAANTLTIGATSGIVVQGVPITPTGSVTGSVLRHNGSSYVPVDEGTFYPNCVGQTAFSGLSLSSTTNVWTTVSGFATINFTKNKASSKLKVSGMGSWYTNNTNSSQAIGFNLDGTSDNLLWQMVSAVASSNRLQWAGTVYISGLAAGAHTFLLRGKNSNATGTFSIDGNDWANLEITEIHA